MKQPLIISCSHHPSSRSALMAHVAKGAMERAGATPDFLDLAEIELPFCDGAEAYAHSNVPMISEKISNASGILLATPVYNYDANAAAKNLLELTGRSWSGKVVGFLCAAGGHSSYMSIMPFASSLMLDFRCVIVPNFVYATGAAFEKDALIDKDVNGRIHHLADDLLNYSKALEGLTYKR